MDLYDAEHSPCEGEQVGDNIDGIVIIRVTRTEVAMACGKETWKKFAFTKRDRLRAIGLTGYVAAKQQ